MRSIYHPFQDGTDIIERNLICPVDKSGFFHGTLKGILSRCSRTYRLASLVAAAKKQSTGLFFYALFESLSGFE